MPKKKKKDGKKKKCNTVNQDPNITINDCANAPKPVTKIKKSVVTGLTATELSWDQLDGNDFDIGEEINEDGSKNFICQKKKNSSKSESETVDELSGKVYPEIVWYHISRFILPEDVGRFAGINRVTYTLTKKERFWRLLYRDFCKDHPRLPQRLRLENGYKVYGLRQRVIRALYHTYELFFAKVTQQAAQDSRPHLLVKRRCVNAWFSKGPSLWSIYFKFKRLSTMQRCRAVGVDFIEELGRVDANPEEDTQVLQVTCESFYEVPPVMGMILTSVSIVLSQGFRHHRIHMGFNTGSYVSRDILPEISVILDTVLNNAVFDWWHPRYPHFDIELPSNIVDDESLPVLKQDFFASSEGDL